MADLPMGQAKGLPPVIKVDLTGKTVVVTGKYIPQQTHNSHSTFHGFDMTTMITGANVGIGIEAAKHFASMGPARLIITCRSEEKGRAAIKSTFLLVHTLWIHADATLAL